MKWQIFISFVFFPSIVLAQINVASNLSIEEYVNDVLLGGGVKARNIKYTGEPIQIARFENKGTRLGYNEGLVLVTGDATICMTNSNGASGGNTNFRSNSTSAFFEEVYDQTLSDLARGAQTFDIAILEFDFIPFGEILTFRYVFASEEYHEYNCTEFNDVFGFMLTGPGYPDPVNLAKIPGSGEIVSINTVNNGSVGSENGELINCIPPRGSLDLTGFFIDNVGGDFLEFDGLTLTLEARAEVVPCETYHIRLAIADIADHNLDSGVFFEKKSFKSAGLEVDVITANNDNVMVEGCTDASIIFTVSVKSDDDVCLDVFFGGRATRGEDYIDDFPTQLCFPKGQSRDTFHLTSLNDNVFEREEEIIIIHDLPKCGFQDTIILFLRDEGFLQVTPDTGRVLVGTESSIQLRAIAGLDPDGTFEWTPATGLSNPFSPTPIATVSDTITYTVTYTDGDCFQQKQVPIVAIPTFKVYIPNVFSPNGDMINDRFTVSYAPGLPFESEIRIFDRWGALVYSTKNSQMDFDSGWDGTVRGKPVQQGVYIYVLIVDAQGEETQMYTGDVTVFR